MTKKLNILSALILILCASSSYALKTDVATLTQASQDLLVLEAEVEKFFPFCELGEVHATLRDIQTKLADARAQVQPGKSVAEIGEAHGVISILQADTEQLFPVCREGADDLLREIQNKFATIWNNLC